jgi:RNA polymerase sigma-70 factor (ECF subfamily)
MRKLDQLEQRWAALMAAAQRGCAESYSKLLREAATMIRSVVARDMARFGLGNSEVEDVVQETLAAIHVKRHTWQAGRPFLPWMRAIVRHKVIDCVRRRYRRVEVPIEGHAEALAVPPPERAATISIERVLAILPARQRAVVTALAFEGASIGETARKLNISTGAVRIAMHRALTALATKFGEWPK